MHRVLAAPGQGVWPREQHQVAAVLLCLVQQRVHNTTALPRGSYSRLLWSAGTAQAMPPSQPPASTTPSPAVQQDALVAIDVGDGRLAGGGGAKAWVKGAHAGAAGGAGRSNGAVGKSRGDVST